MKIGFIGCGNMATAMIKGILNKKVCSASEILVSHKTQEGCEKSKKELGVESTTDNRKVAAQSAILVLAVKPQFYEEVIMEIRESIQESTLVITIAPGKTLEWLEAAFDKKVKLIRTMPNTPATVGEGMTGACHNQWVTKEDMEKAAAVLRSFGKMEFVKEEEMDAVVSISGSSPAYVFMFVDAMISFGVEQGMEYDQAYEFAAQAVLGSAKLLLETKKDPGELTRAVCSPGGTTLEAVKVFDEKKFQDIIKEAMEACCRRAKEL